MNELAFPLLGALVVFAVVVPCATLVAKAALVARRRGKGGLLGFGSSTTHLLIVAPVLAPALWFLSAALHESEASERIAACIHDHLGGGACCDALAFALCVAGLLLWAFVRRARRELAWRPHVLRAPATSARARRLAAVCASHSELRRLGGRIFAVEGARDHLCTRGLLRPVIEVGTDIIDRLDDSALASALLHEAEHATAFDPLRFLLASMSLSLNPFARLLESELARWRLAREAVCDAGAVRSGGCPLSLAEAIVAAARPAGGAPPPLAAGLHGGGACALHLRVQLLLEWASAPPAVAPRRVALLTPLFALVALVLLPHSPDATWPLDGLRAGIEGLVRLLGIG